MILKILLLFAAVVMAGVMLSDTTGTAHLDSEANYRKLRVDVQETQSQSLDARPETSFRPTRLVPRGGVAANMALNCPTGGGGISTTWDGVMTGDDGWCSRMPMDTPRLHDISKLCCDPTGCREQCGALAAARLGKDLGVRVESTPTVFGRLYIVLPRND